MMLNISRLLAITTLMLLGACTQIRYSDDFKSGTEFNGLKTYQWRSVTVDIGGTDKDLLQRLADNQLRTQGFVAADKAPDVLLDLQVFSRESSGGNTSIGIGIGMPVGRHGSVGLGTGQILGKGKQEGVIVIDVTQTKSNTLIWRGTAEGIPLINFSLKAEHKLSESFTQLLQQFPPKSKAK
ncbi:DUF4136 domain-containing protein [Cellvibrio mixtus]|uniref:DUF4136 domain-containing protein n=1 Tax=Cellvibrio mixtus TaxID=39650 RepID=UPI000587C9FE|nr:DUF4136 domain-containing protein [Cellvibrio mixtus]